MHKRHRIKSRQNHWRKKLLRRYKTVWQGLAAIEIKHFPNMKDCPLDPVEAFPKGVTFGFLKMGTMKVDCK